MNRRELLQGIGLLLGSSISSPIAAAVFDSARRSSEGEEWSPRTLSADQIRTVSAIAEAILPSTDTPGAAAARVDQFVDLLLSDWLDRETTQRFLAGLGELQSSCFQVTGRSFPNLSLEQQIRLLEPLDRHAWEARQALARGEIMPTGTCPSSL